MNTRKIMHSMEKDFNEEFLKLRQGLEIHLKQDFDIKVTRNFLKDYVPKEVIGKAEILLDTILNYLMEQAGFDLEQADIKLQNSFYERDFRKIIRKWTKKVENQLTLEPSSIQFSLDTRLLYGSTTAGMTAVAGVAATVAFSTGRVIAAIIGGIATLIASAIAFKLGFEKGASKSRSKVKSEVEHYIADSETLVLEWLKRVVNVFAAEFDEFCRANAYSPGKE